MTEGSRRRVALARSRAASVYRELARVFASQGDSARAERYDRRARMYEPDGRGEASPPAQVVYEIRDRAGLTLSSYESEASAAAALRALVTLGRRSGNGLLVVEVRADAPLTREPRDIC